MPTEPIITLNDIEAAAQRIAPFIRRTPLLASKHLDKLTQGRILVKAEPLQITGSFKLRGACNALQNLDQNAKAVVAWSSGNHAQAVAYAALIAAKNKPLPAFIVMPEDAPQIKKNLTQDLVKETGGEIITYNRTTESREDIGTALAEKHQAAIIPPYDSLAVIAGQGTVGLEIAQDLKSLENKHKIIPDQLLCCTGGGGLLAGVAGALQALMPQVKIYAAEPSGFDDFSKSLKAGHRLANAPEAQSICDAIVTPTPGAITFPINRRFVTAGLVVSDDEVLYAMAMAWAHLKIVLEPGGAVALAAALAGKVNTKNKTTIVIASGGNVDKKIFQQALKYL